MTTTFGTVDLSPDTAQIELESCYQKDFLGFDPMTWAAMAYSSKGYSHDDVRLLLAKRFGDDVISKRDALVRESKLAGTSNKDSHYMVFAGGLK